MTKNEGEEAILNRIQELYTEIDRIKNIISVNRKHLAIAKRRVRILERGAALIAKGHWAKADRVFKNEILNP